MPKKDKENKDKINEINLDKKSIKQNLDSNVNEDIINNWFALPLKNRISQRNKSNNKANNLNLNKEIKPTKRKDIYPKDNSGDAFEDKSNKDIRKKKKGWLDK